MILLFFFISYWIGLSWRYSWILFGIIAFGYLAFLWWRFGRKVSIVASIIFFMGFGTSFIKFSFDQKVYKGVVVESSENYYILESKFEKLYVYEKENEKEIGDILALQGNKEELDFTLLESQFDFKEYLNKKGIYKKLNVLNETAIFTTFIKIKQWRASFLSHFDGDSKAIVSAVLFSKQIDSPLTTRIENLHLSRLISASGVYIYIFISILEYLLSKKIKDKYAKLLTLGILSIYFIFTFPRFAVLKIFFIYLLKWLNEFAFKKKFDYLTIFAFSGFVFLIFNYRLAYQDGFILGYTIPIYIRLIAPVVDKNKNKFIRKLLSAFLIYIFFIPFETKYYNSAQPFSFANQIIFSPYFILISIVGIITFFGLPIFKVIEWLLVPLRYILIPFEKLKLELYAPAMNEWLILIYYLFLFFLIHYLSIGFKPIYKKMILISLPLMSLYFIPVNNLLTESVTFINVGQGDSCLIRKGMTTILLDTGGLKYADIAKQTLIPFLKKERIYKVDLLITTHDDFDHSGGVSSLMNNFNVTTYVKDFKEFPIELNGITLHNYNSHINELKDENDKSLVIGFKLMKTNFLIMGDAPIEIEKNIIKENANLPCDVLKVGHHGSKTSSCDEFIKFVNPKEAIISVGKNNSYGHPNKSVIDILKKNNITIKRTDELGTIKYSNYIFM